VPLATGLAALLCWLGIRRNFAIMPFEASMAIFRLGK
jgi:hypothetical protein